MKKPTLEDIVKTTFKATGIALKTTHKAYKLLRNTFVSIDDSAKLSRIALPVAIGLTPLLIAKHYSTQMSNFAKYFSYTLAGITSLAYYITPLFPEKKISKSPFNISKVYDIVKKVSDFKLPIDIDLIRKALFLTTSAIILSNTYILFKPIFLSSSKEVKQIKVSKTNRKEKTTIIYKQLASHSNHFIPGFDLETMYSKEIIDKALTNPEFLNAYIDTISEAIINTSKDLGIENIIIAPGHYPLSGQIINDTLKESQLNYIIAQRIYEKLSKEGIRTTFIDLSKAFKEFSLGDIDFSRYGAKNIDEIISKKTLKKKIAARQLLLLNLAYRSVSMNEIAGYYKSSFDDLLQVLSIEESRDKEKRYFIIEVHQDKTGKHDLGIVIPNQSRTRNNSSISEQFALRLSAYLNDSTPKIPNQLMKGIEVVKKDSSKDLVERVLDPYKLQDKIKQFSPRIIKENRLPKELANLVLSKEFQRFFLAFLYNESKFDPRAVSRTGAVGLGQIKRNTWNEYSHMDTSLMFNPDSNMYVSMKIYTDYLKKVYRVVQAKDTNLLYFTAIAYNLGITNFYHLINDKHFSRRDPNKFISQLKQLLRRRPYTYFKYNKHLTIKKGKAFEVDSYLKRLKLYYYDRKFPDYVVSKN